MGETWADVRRGRADPGLTYENAILELESANLDGLEELWDRFLIWLRYCCAARRYFLIRGEEGNAWGWGVLKFARHCGSW